MTFVTPDSYESFKKEFTARTKMNPDEKQTEYLIYSNTRMMEELYERLRIVNNNLVQILNSKGSVG